MNKTRKKIGILSLCAVALSYMSLSPIIASIAANFPGVSETLPQMADGTSEAAKGSAFEMNKYIFGLFIIGILYFAIQNSFNTNSSAYVVDILGEGPAMASMITLINTIGGIVGGMTFRTISIKLKNQIETFTLVVVAIGFVITFFIHSNIAFILGSFLIGYGFAIINASGAYLLSLNTKPETNAFTVSIYLALTNLAAAVSPIVVNSLSGLFGEGVPVRFMFSGIAVAIIGAYSLILNLGKKA